MSDKRRSKAGFWFDVCEDACDAKRLAQRWAFSGKLGKLVI